MDPPVSTASTTTPPSAAQLRQALDLLEIHGPARADAALHLALPVDAPLGMAAWLESGVWHYRSATRPATSDPVADARALAAAGHREGDRYHDLSRRDPLSWCKLVTSGTRQVLFGSDLLLGAPAVSASAEVPAAAVRQVVREWLADPEMTLPALVTTEQGSFPVEGTNAWMAVSSPLG